MKKSDSDVKLRKSIVVVIEIAFLLTMVISIVVLKSVTSQDKEDMAFDSIVYKTVTFAQTKEYTNNKNEEQPQLTQTFQSNNWNEPELNNPAVSVAVLPDPSGWSTAQIISTAKDSVNKTKAYTSNLTVNHSEGFTANVTECSAGGIVRSVVDLMIGWVVKPVEETLVYQNGKAVNSDGEVVPIVLPKRNGFSLDESGVKSATIQRTGNEYIIKIILFEESVGMYDVPAHNAASIGYLDVASFDISFMEIDSADIVYKGSSIELRINAEGYVTYANYKIPLQIKGSAHKGSISGSATIEGEQTEEWRLNY